MNRVTVADATMPHYLASAAVTVIDNAGLPRLGT